LEQVSSIPRAGGGYEPFDEPRPDSSQQEMGERYFLHLPLDDEGEARWQERLQDQSVQVAGVIRDYYAVIPGNPVQASQAGADSGDKEPRAGRCGDESPPSVEARDRQRSQNCGRDTRDERRPRI